MGADMNHHDGFAETQIEGSRGSEMLRRTNRSPGTPSSGRGLLKMGGLCLLLAALASGCNLELLGTEDNPQTIDAEDVGGPSAFNARFIGARSDFSAGFDDAVVYGGLFTDELTWGGSFVARQEIDLRNVPSSNDIMASEPYTSLQTAAKTSGELVEEIAAGNFESQVPNPSESDELAQMALFAGYSRLYLADLFCTLAFDGTGPEVSSEDVWQTAAEQFGTAIGASNASADVRSAALVGRARARLMLGDEGGALQDAQAVPEGFEFFVNYSGASDREENDVNDLTWVQERLSVSPEFRNLTIDDTDTPDTRVALFATGSTGFSGGVLQFNPLKHQSRTSPIRLASWEEAQFIIAEIEGGEAARQIIDDLRERRGLPKWEEGATATDEEIRDKVIEEKARALFSEGQRMGDLRRYADRFGLDLFPELPASGDQTCMPLPDLERDNNPDI